MPHFSHDSHELSAAAPAVSFGPAARSDPLTSNVLSSLSELQTPLQTISKYSTLDLCDAAGIDIQSELQLRRWKKERERGMLLDQEGVGCR